MTLRSGRLLLCALWHYHWEFSNLTITVNGKDIHSSNWKWKHFCEFAKPVKIICSMCFVHSMCFVASCWSLQSTACSHVFADHRGSLLPPASPLMVSIGVGKYFHWVFSVTGVGRWTVVGLPWLPPCAGIRASSTSTLWHLIPSSSIGDEFNRRSVFCITLSKERHNSLHTNLSSPSLWALVLVF